MASELNGYQVLEIAEKMERNAAKFYRKAAGLCDDPKLCKLFAELAQWEKRHVQVFAEMRERLSEHTWELGYFELDRAAPAVTEPPLPPVFGDHDDPSKELTAGTSRTDVLRMAIRKEKDSIRYYNAMKEFVLGINDVEVIRLIIREEKRHVAILTQSLEQINGR